MEYITVDDLSLLSLRNLLVIQFQRVDCSCANKETGDVDYSDLLRKLNWRDCAVPPPSVPVSLAADWQGTKAANQLNAINYACLMKDLRGSGGN